MKKAVADTLGIAAFAASDAGNEGLATALEFASIVANPAQLVGELFE